MSPLKLAARLLKIVSALLLVAMVLILVPLGIPYLENASSYAWVRQVNEMDGKLIGVVKGMFPTKAGGFDFARLVLLGVAYALSRVLESVSNLLAKKASERDLKRRYESFAKSAGLPENSKALAAVKKKMESLKPGDERSREDLIRLMIETKKKLDSLSKDLAFLAIDVVGSTDMKLGEDKAYVEHDFREYKKLVEGAMDAHGPLKSAWTPDGVMICFSTVDDAIRTAQGVLNGLEHFNREVKAMKTQFRVRCGINAGKVHYDKATPMEEMSDRAIDVAGHMQKYAASDTIFIAREVLEKAEERSKEGFQPTGQEVDSYEVYKWKAASADPTMVGQTQIVGQTRMGVGQTRFGPGATDARRIVAEAAGEEVPQAQVSETAFIPLSELSSPKVSGRTPSVQELTAKAAASVDPRAMPKSLGKYELKRELGRGAMGVVYEGWDPHIERRVALKTIRADQLQGSESEEMIARFKREAKAAGRLSHPNIVAVYEFGQEGAVSFIAMEFIEGRELKDYFDKGERFHLTEIVRLMTQLLDALDTAGRAGIVHRDIKPSNIMLLANGTLKVADFGIARVESSALTQTGAALGTPLYMSPEQLMGLVVDGRSDLFSAGVVLYQFLTGEKPFSGERTTTIITKVLSENPPDPSKLDVTVPKSFDLLMRKALAKRPDERFQNGREFAEALKHAMEHRGEAVKTKDGDDATLVVKP